MLPILISCGKERTMRKRICMLEVVLMVVVGCCVLAGVRSSAEAVIVVRSAAVQNGVAVVEGGNAARGASIFWEGALVTQANNGGHFALQGVVPADCVGSLHESNPATVIDVALANCTTVSKAPAPVPQTGQSTPFAPGDDGSLQAGIAWPIPRFTDRGDGT